MEKVFKVLNKKQGCFPHEQPFACYIIKEICLLSGISGLMFDPDTSVICGCALDQRLQIKLSHFKRNGLIIRHFYN